MSNLAFAYTQEVKTKLPNIIYIFLMFSLSTLC